MVSGVRVNHRIVIARGLGREKKLMRPPRATVRSPFLGYCLVSQVPHCSKAALEALGCTGDSIRTTGISNKVLAPFATYRPAERLFCRTLNNDSVPVDNLQSSAFPRWLPVLVDVDGPVPRHLTSTEGDVVWVVVLATGGKTRCWLIGRNSLRRSRLVTLEVLRFGRDSARSLGPQVCRRRQISSTVSGPRAAELVS